MSCTSLHAISNKLRHQGLGNDLLTQKWNTYIIVASKDFVEIGNDFDTLTKDEDGDNRNEDAGQVDFFVVYWTCNIVISSDHVVSSDTQVAKKSCYACMLLIPFSLMSS